MLLRKLEIKNFRCLEDVAFDKFDNFNVFIGRNNSGKSSAFGAISLVNQAIRGLAIEWDSVLTGKDKTRCLKIELAFETVQSDREHFLSLIPKTTLSESRCKELLNSPFLRHIDYQFGTHPANPQQFFCTEVKAMGEDNQQIILFKRLGLGSNSPQCHLLDVLRILQAKNDERFTAESMGPKRYGPQEVTIYPNFTQQGEFGSSTPSNWPLWTLSEFLKKAFFFSPFRHSTPRLQSSAANALAQDGSNLAQVLHTLNSNNRYHFKKIEDFINAALPEIGILQPYLDGATTEVNFFAPDGKYMVRMHDMGAGIEQLLMVAVVLVTTQSDCPLFLEEPENHLHAGAQRFLIENLYESQRQVFVTTHSTTFVNLSRRKTIFHFAIKDGKTLVRRLDAEPALSVLFEDLGMRNSDLLLSDAVVFVEGSADRLALNAWSRKLGMNLVEHNINVFVMGGSDQRGARVRADLLEGISQKAAVPHLFVFDLDERKSDEVELIRKQLKERVVFLEKRELENYFLLPRVLKAALRQKLQASNRPSDVVDSKTDREIQDLIKSTARELYGLVLLKRVRLQVPALAGGFFPREIANNLATEFANPELGQLITNAIQARQDEHFRQFDMRAIVDSERVSLDEVWKDEAKQLELAPGTEIVAAVFARFGLEYVKPQDTVRLVEEMTLEEIHPEIKGLINEISKLRAKSAT